MLHLLFIQINHVSGTDLVSWVRWFFRLGCSHFRAGHWLRKWKMILILNGLTLRIFLFFTRFIFPVICTPIPLNCVRCVIGPSWIALLSISAIIISTYLSDGCRAFLVFCFPTLTIFICGWDRGRCFTLNSGDFHLLFNFLLLRNWFSLC